MAATACALALKQVTRGGVWAGPAFGNGDEVDGPAVSGASVTELAGQNQVLAAMVGPGSSSVSSSSLPLDLVSRRCFAVDDHQSCC